MPVRPTLRCLTHDLGLKIQPLDEFDHPLLRKANQPAEQNSSRERISSIDATVLLTVKAQRWRGAFWIDAAGRPWMDRFAAEGSVRLVRELDATVRRLVRASLLDGHEHTAQVAKAALGVLVRADSGHETYVALRILGSVPKNLLIVILDLVSGCDRNAWFRSSPCRTTLWRPGNKSGRT